MKELNHGLGGIKKMPEFNFQIDPHIPSTCTHHSNVRSLSSLSSVPENLEQQSLQEDFSGSVIIVALDLRQESKQAFNCAMEEHARPGDVVYLLHVRPGDNYYEVGRKMGLASSNNKGDTYLLCIENLLEKLANEARERYMVKCVPVIKSGIPEDIILDEVIIRDADLLVLGFRKMGAIHRRFHHSVSHYCESHAECPVLVVGKRSKLIAPSQEM